MNNNDVHRLRKELVKVADSNMNMQQSRDNTQNLGLKYISNTFSDGQRHQYKKETRYR
jgi:hypothetical protein